jgi:transglutaminase-like putative cysteine protease
VIYDIQHVTRYVYASPVRHAQCNLRLKPIDWPGQRLLDHRLELTPPASQRREKASPFAANVTTVVIEERHDELIIDTRSRVDVDRPAGPPRDGLSIADARSLALAARDLGPLAPANYLYASPLIPADAAIAAYATPSLADGKGVVASGLELARRIHDDFQYEPGATDTATPVGEAFGRRRGVCQDFAHIMISGLRAAGLAAGYVSGYLRTRPPPGRPRLMGVDATHAWVVLWCGPDHGYVGFDPTNGIAMGEEHIVVAVGRDYSDVAPVEGIFLGKTAQKLEVAVDVVPVGSEL